MRRGAHGRAREGGREGPRDARALAGAELGSGDPPWRDRRVVLGVAGGIAAYKAVQVARDLTLLGSRVDVVLTRSARQFVAPLSFEGVTGRGPLVDAFQVGGAALHVGLGRKADCVCVAPATADFIARAAAGRASDLLSTVVAATDAPVVLAPSMNHRMFTHPRTQANLAILDASLGVRRVGPDTGPLAAGEGSGIGRMASPADIVDMVGRTLSRECALKSARVLVTAGPTREAVDIVRYVGNRSSGKMGYALARAAYLRGADVILVSGPVGIPAPFGVEVVAVESAREMRQAVLDRMAGVDVVIHAAAVSDYRPEAPVDHKIKRSLAGSDLTIRMVANPDIAAESAARARAGTVVVGFALECEDLVTRAAEKLKSKGLDLIVANRAAEMESGMEADYNQVVIVEPGQPSQSIPRMRKFRVAGEILDRIEAVLCASGS